MLPPPRAWLPAAAQRPRAGGGCERGRRPRRLVRVRVRAALVRLPPTTPQHHPACCPNYPWRRSHSALPTLGLVAGSGQRRRRGQERSRRRLRRAAAGRPARRAHAGWAAAGTAAAFGSEAFASEPPLGAAGPEPCARDVAGRWAQAVGAGGGAGGSGGGGGERLQQPAPRLRLHRCCGAVGTTDLTGRFDGPRQPFLARFLSTARVCACPQPGTAAAAGCCSSPAAAAVAGRGGGGGCWLGCWLPAHFAQGP